MIELNDTNIRHFKLSSGDELIALVSGTSDTSMVTLEHPMLIRIEAHDDGYRIMFSNWQPMSKDDTCQLNPMHIVSHAECTNNIKEQYIRICIGSNNDRSEPDDLDAFDDHYESLLSDNGPDESEPIH